jgi:uncharacterized protein YcgI (DUF1989 family)
MTCIIAPQTGVGFKLTAGERLKVIDKVGSQVSDLFCVSYHDHKEVLSSGRSIDYNDTIYLTKGHDLYSNRSNVMLKIVEDTCARHDFLYTPCSLRMFQIMAGNEEHHPSCHENLAKAFAEIDVSSDDIGTTFNIFMNVSVDSKGAIKIHKPQSKPGDYIVFEAQMDLYVGLTACSDEATNDFSFKPIAYEIFR